MTTKKTQPGDEQPKRPRSTKPKAESTAKPRTTKPKAEAPETKSESAPRKSAPKPKAEASEAKPRSKSVHHDGEERVTEKSAQHHNGRPASPASPRGTKSRSARRSPQTVAPSKMILVAALVLTAFIGSYKFAAAKSAGKGVDISGANPAGVLAAAAPAGGGCGMSGGGGAAGAGAAGAGAAGAGAAGGGGGGCCGGGGAPVEGKTTVEGSVQKIAVDTSAGSFNPNVIKAKAGVPIELAFSQAPGGCLSGVLFPDFGIQEDLTAGGKTVKLPALEKGEYSFFCQMQMVSAKIVVE